MFISSRINMSWVLLSKTTIDISWTRGRRKAEFKILELIQIKSCFRKDSVANSTNQTLASWQSRISSAANCLKITRSANHESAFTADKTRDCKITKRWRWPIFFVNWRCYLFLQLTKIHLSPSDWQRTSAAWYWVLSTYFLSIAAAICS